MNEIDEAWLSFCNEEEYYPREELSIENKIENINDKITPKCSEIYISTKTKIAYLNQSINLTDIFWKIKIIPYVKQTEGVVKKQIKLSSSNEYELNNIKSKLKNEKYVEEYIITSIKNPEGRIAFKDIRKISIGLSKKDIINYRCRQKSAFYNCFVMILRILHEDIFREVHVKVFNTGKLEIPGIQTDVMLGKVLQLLIKELDKYIESDKKIDYILDKTETVLINSNFNCGYFIERNALFDILKFKYRLNCNYDPCSYPGIQSEFHYDEDKVIQDGKQNNCVSSLKVSFMIFRTGSVLIVGKCSEKILYEIYDFLKEIFKNEYINIGRNNLNNKNINTKATIGKKLKKKVIIFDSSIK